MKDIENTKQNKKSESESEIQQAGYKPLDAEEILSHVIGKTFLGSFPPSFKYIIALSADGSLEGKNNYQHYDVGKWTLDVNNHTLSVSWDLGWENTTNRVYLVAGVVKMFDTTSGQCNTSFDEPIEGVESIQTFDF